MSTKMCNGSTGFKNMCTKRMDCSFYVAFLEFKGDRGEANDITMSSGKECKYFKQCGKNS